MHKVRWEEDGFEPTVEYRIFYGKGMWTMNWAQVLGA
jgi:hypothetical protein